MHCLMQPRIYSPSIPQLVSSLVKRESRWRNLRMRINRKLKNANNSQLIKKRQSGDYTCCFIKSTIPLLVTNLVKTKSK